MTFIQSLISTTIPLFTENMDPLDAELFEACGAQVFLKRFTPSMASCAVNALSRGANPLSRDSKFGYQALRWASRSRFHVDVIRQLLKAGVDVEDRGRRGDYCGTPLIAAASSGCLPVVELLLEWGALADAREMSWDGSAFIEIPDQAGATALCLASRFGQAACAFALIDAGANPHLSVCGQSPAMIARKRGYPDIAKSIEARWRARSEQLALNSELPVLPLTPRRSRLKL